MDKKTMGLWSCVALVVGNMIGSGIFMLPSVLAGYGSLTLWGWAASLIAALPYDTPEHASVLVKGSRFMQMERVVHALRTGAANAA